MDLGRLLEAPSWESPLRHTAELLAVAGQLSPDSPVLVPHTETATAEARLAAVDQLGAAGLRLRPVIAARRLRSAAEAEVLLRSLVTERGIREVFLTGGDLPAPAGPYRSGLSLVESGALEGLGRDGRGLALVGVPGHPAGHPRISDNELMSSLVRKVSALEARGLSVEITTQIVLDPSAVAAWIHAVRERGITVPVRIAVPRLTDPSPFLRELVREAGADLAGARMHLSPSDSPGAALAWLRSMGTE
ncbi:hypothetical protein [Brevibacterium salitolerans]|uniref:Methylenetetrahydrofolate reductase n=1 Tax=Brevibacterium salitolerans TaxID=1403566 RepID=A0ABN2X4Z5_9MICO